MKPLTEPLVFVGKQGQFCLNTFRCGNVVKFYKSLIKLSSIGPHTIGLPADTLSFLNRTTSRISFRLLTEVFGDGEALDSRARGPD
jgi:hypothetical protein